MCERPFRRHVVSIENDPAMNRAVGQTANDRRGVADEARSGLHAALLRPRAVVVFPARPLATAALHVAPQFSGAILQTI